MVRKIVHGLAALEAGAVLLLTAYLLDFGIKNSAIVLLCFGALPLMFLSAAVLVFQSSKSRVPRAAAVLLVLAPVLALTASGLDEAVSKLRWHDYASGRGYFSGADAWALGAAVMRGDAAAVAIAARSTDVNQVGKWDKTFLGLALSKPVLDVATAKAKALLDAGANPDQDGSWPLRTAFSREDAAMLALLLDAGADPSRVGRTGRPVFFEALDQPGMLALLLQHGVQVDATDGEGWTALMLATRNGKWPAVALLLAAGADVGHVARDGSGLREAAASVRRTAETRGQPVPHAPAWCMDRVVGSEKLGRVEDRLLS